MREGHGELIMVVDDEDSILAVTRQILEAHNYRVLAAADGVEAIAQYSQQPADISAVLMDASLPNLDGETTARILQRIDLKIKVVVTSGLSSNQQIAASLGQSATSFLHKPYSPAKLLQVIHQAVEG